MLVRLEGRRTAQERILDWQDRREGAAGEGVEVRDRISGCETGICYEVTVAFALWQPSLDQSLWLERPSPRVVILRTSLQGLGQVPARRLLG